LTLSRKGDAMTDSTADATPASRVRRFPATRILLALLPLALLGGVLGIILATNAGLGDRQAPPIETLAISRISLPRPGLIEVEVINDGPDPVTVAQVLVDEAYWQFTMAPDTTLDRLQSATIAIPYPWVEGESHTVALISATGIVFEATIPVAIESPHADRATVGRFALVGLYVGIVPIALGLLWYPTLRRLGRRGLNFVLALTVGLLAFLVVDMWDAAHEVALTVAGSFDAPVLIPLLAALSAALLVVAGRALRSTSGGLPLAYSIATGIGLHNLGEGLAIGAAFAAGEAALGVFLIVGFTLHNVTEGIGIATPVVRERPALRHFAALAAIAGLPAIAGTWIGAFVYSPLWTTVFLAIGIGALAQVIVEIGRLIVRDHARAGEPGLTWSTFSGFATGLTVMYLTALLVAA
jgi:hypothetical protein